MKIDLYKSVDKIIGIPLCYFLSVFSVFFSKNKDVKKILLIKLWAVGDSVVTLPLINALREKFPNSEIDILARKRNQEIFKHNKDIKRILLFESNNYLQLLSLFRQYDLAFDTEPYLNISALLSFWMGKTKIGFSNQHRSILYDVQVDHDKKQHMVQNYLDMIRALGFTVNYDKLIPINSSKQDEAKIDIFSKKINKKIVGLCVGTAESASKTRIWDDKKWAELADNLSEQNYQVIFVGSKNEKSKIEQIFTHMKSSAINSAGEFSLLETCELIKTMNLFISIDTGPMHIAAAQGVKTIGLFGPTTPTLWKPYGKNNIAIYKNLSCSPCIINDKGRTPDCLRKTDRYACMQEISVEEVLRAVNYIKQNDFLKQK
ncbi:glycosyltransferase family 9 protein [archaeon]|nr:glycosyltransferase family 9 protein [archaeon]